MAFMEIANFRGTSRRQPNQVYFLNAIQDSACTYLNGKWVKGMLINRGEWGFVTEEVATIANNFRNMVAVALISPLEF